MVGGVYRESVRSHHKFEIYGSGGRAAATLAALKVAVKLVTALDDDARRLFQPIADGYGFELLAERIPQTTEFVYDHPLGPPRTRPLLTQAIERGLQVEAADAVVFGMLEGDPVVRAQRVVYDPQNPLRPRWFEDTGSTAEEVFYVLNRREGEVLTGHDEPDAIVRAIVARPGVVGCALKLGPRGALTTGAGGELVRVPCYRTKTVWPVGSGDVFAAVTAWSLFVEGTPHDDAVHAASRGVATYCETGAMPSQPDLLLGRKPFHFPEVRAKAEGPRPRLYLASPFFAIQDRWLVEETRDVLHGFGLDVFSPVHEIGPGEASVVAPQDLEGLRSCGIVLALLDALDPGTLMEIGYARALDIPVLAYVRGVGPEDLKMIEGSGCSLETDFTTALYRVTWDALEA